MLAGARHDRHGGVAALVAAVAVVAAAGCGDGGRQATEAGGGTAPAARTAATARSAPAPRVAWTRDALLRRLEGRRIRVAGRVIRIDGDTLVCRGVGPPARSGPGGPAWTRFRCLQPTFPPGAVAGPDAIFTVEPVGPGAFVVVGGRLTTY